MIVYDYFPYMQYSNLKHYLNDLMFTCNDIIDNNDVIVTDSRGNAIFNPITCIAGNQKTTARKIANDNHVLTHNVLKDRDGKIQNRELLKLGIVTT